MRCWIYTSAKNRTRKGIADPKNCIFLAESTPRLASQFDALA